MKRNHVWVVERYRRSQWRPLICYCGNSKASANRLLKMYTEEEPGTKFRLRKYTQDSSGEG